VKIRPAVDGDLEALLDVERAAFGGEAEADLVTALLGDPSALPIINLVAEMAGTVVGHALFTRAVVDSGGANVEATILAPLAVHPASQRTGVGLALCREGISVAERLGIGLIFLAGHIDYYPRLGFRPAFPLGLDAPYPFDPAVADAWMVLETRPGLIGAVRGTVTCADALMSPEMWVE
jgi:predicted N-acetyltransferase YhbS